MFGCSEIKRCKKTLADLRQKEEKAESQLERTEKKYSSREWPGYFTGSVKRYEERYLQCAPSEERDIIIGLCNELDAASSQIDDFIENEYALAVFTQYSKKRPKLIRISTDEVYEWEAAFGTDFSKIEKGLRHSLVGLVEEPTRYRFK